MNEPPVVEQSESTRVATARTGDRPAFGCLYDLYSRMVHGILLARVPPAEVADLVQDVFLLALGRLDTLRDNSAFGGWLVMITRNRASDFHSRVPHATEVLPDAFSGSNVEKPERDTEALAALAAIRALPETYRETLILRLVEGMTGPEIAARTGMTPASVRARVFNRLAEVVPPPAGVTREGVLRGTPETQRQMRDLWWDSLGLGDTSWWRMWKGRIPFR